MKLKINNIQQEFDFDNNDICQLILEDSEMFFNKTNNILKLNCTIQLNKFLILLQCCIDFGINSS